MATREGPPALLETPQEHINFVPAKEGEIIKLGPLTLRVMEDGSHTGTNLTSSYAFVQFLSSFPQPLIIFPDNRLGAVELIIPPNTSGPPAHWHEMHDETFLVTKGTVRFHTTGLKEPQPDVDAKTGDYVTVPVRAPHTFSNPFDEEARFFSTVTPAFYVSYFKLMAKMVEEHGKFTPEINKAAMSAFATIPVDK